MAKKKTWKNPAKQPPKKATMAMTADWGQFTDTMKRIITKNPATR